MFGIGIPEMILILAIALIVIGPKKLPDLAKSLGRALGEFKKATSELKESMELDHDFKGVKKTFDDIGGEIRGSLRDTPTRKEESPSRTGQKKTDLEHTDDQWKKDQATQPDTVDDAPTPEHPAETSAGSDVPVNSKGSTSNG
jgi:TatA/E family protein of Tat protein translocase